MNKKAKSIKSKDRVSIKIVKYIPVIVLILADAFFFQKSSDWRTFPILIFYVFLIIRFKISSKATFFICLFLFILIYIHYAFSPSAVYENQYPLAPIGEKLAVWLYLFLIIGIIQKWREKDSH